MDEPRRFRRLPTRVTAIRWTGCNEAAVAAFVGEVGEFETENGSVFVEIATLEGIVVAEPGDWLIRDPAGGLSACDPGVFDLFYEHDDR